MSAVRRLRPSSYVPEAGQLHAVILDGRPALVRSARFAALSNAHEEAVEEFAADLMEQAGIGPKVALDEARRVFAKRHRGARS